MSQVFFNRAFLRFSFAELAVLVCRRDVAQWPTSAARLNILCNVFIIMFFCDEEASVRGGGGHRLLCELFITFIQIALKQHKFSLACRRAHFL